MRASVEIWNITRGIESRLNSSWREKEVPAQSWNFPMT